MFSLFAFAQDGSPTGTCAYQEIPISGASSATGINDIGAIVGEVFVVLGPQNADTHAFLLFNGKTTIFQFPGAESTFALAINNHAQIVGLVGPPHSATAGFGFVVRDGKFHLIAVPNTRSNNATAISDKGDVVGDLVTNDGVQKSYFLHNGKFHIFRFPGSAQTFVSGINSDGVIVGSYDDSGVNSPMHGFMVKNGIFTTVDFPGAQNTSLTGINNKGDIVGFWVNSDNANHGFVFKNGNFWELSNPPNLV